MATDDIQDLVEEATFDFTMGEHEKALEKLKEAVSLDPGSFEAWHAMAEIYFSIREWNPACEAAKRAEKIKPEDIHIHTSLSRIYMEKGDKATAEKHGAKARMLGWKRDLQGETEKGD